MLRSVRLSRVKALVFSRALTRTLMKGSEVKKLWCPCGVNLETSIAVLVRLVLVLSFRVTCRATSRTVFYTLVILQAGSTLTSTDELFTSVTATTRTSPWLSPLLRSLKIRLLTGWVVKLMVQALNVVTALLVGLSGPKKSLLKTSVSVRLQTQKLQHLRVELIDEVRAVWWSRIGLILRLLAVAPRPKSLDTEIFPPL